MSNIRINQNEYNVGALSGKYALRDLSNTGKFSNTVEELPVKASFKLVEDSGTIILKQGSLLPVPFGFSDVDGVSLVNKYHVVNKDVSINVGHTINDYTQTSSTDEKTYLVYNYDAGILEADNRVDYQYFPNNVEEDGEIIYPGNTFLRTSSKSKCALPLGYFNDVWHWHPFTAIGFYKDLLWVDSGVKYFIPDGRDDIYSLNVDIIRSNTIVYTTLAEMTLGTLVEETDSGLLFLDTKCKGQFIKDYSTEVEYSTHSGYQYVSSENYIYGAQQNKVKVCKVCNISISNNLFHELKNFNTYQTLDYAEIINSLDKIESTVLHKDNREETSLSKVHFTNENTFDNIIINGGTINNINIAGDIELGETGGFSLVDAKIESVVKSKNPNCINIVGKSNPTRGGIVLGTNEIIKVIGNEDDASISVSLPTNKVDSGGKAITPKILPATSEVYDIGDTGARFRNMYAKIFDGLAMQTNWADLAEKYETDKEYPVGTLVQFGGEKEITIATSEVNAVISECPGVILNNNEKGQPIALMGRVRVRVTGKVNKFDKIYLSSTAGCGSIIPNGKVIGRALENKDTEDINLVLCSVKFEL